MLLVTLIAPVAIEFDPFSRAEAHGVNCGTRCSQVDRPIRGNMHWIASARHDPEKLMHYLVSDDLDSTKTVQISSINWPGRKSFFRPTGTRNTSCASQVTLIADRVPTFRRELFRIDDERVIDYRVVVNRFIQNPRAVFPGPWQFSQPIDISKNACC